MDLIAEGLAALAGEPVEGRWLGEDLIRLLSLRDRIDAQFSRRLEVFDARGDGVADGHRCTVGWLADRCRMDPADATRAVRTARALRSLPAVQDAWESGATTSAHVGALSRVRYRAKADEHFDQLEHLWRELAVTHDTRVLGRALAGFVDQLDHTRPADASSAAHAIARRMLIGSHCLDVGLLEARYDTESYNWIWNAVEHQRERAHVDGDERTIDQQRADALVEICQHYTRCTSDPHSYRPPVVNILTDLATLTQLEAGVCHDDRGLAWHPETVRRLCCHSEIARILVNSDSEILDVGRSDRFFNRAQRRAMFHRDRGCCFPGCRRPVRQTEPHHIHPWEHGGTTDLDHGCLLCWAHHRLVHEQRWTIHRRNDHSIDWYKPDHTHHATWHPPSRPPPITLTA